MCGIFGIYAPNKPVAKLTYLGLYALQHRGQESAGIAVADSSGKISHHLEMGLVSQAFKEKDLNALSGIIALGHCRYSTTGATNIYNAQPIINTFAGQPFALAHNGNLINIKEIRDALERAGYRFLGSSDSEIISALISRSSKACLEEAILEVTKMLQGAYTFIILTKDKLIALRDPHGFRPLVIGKTDQGYVIASEDCALSVVGAQLLREVHPGEMVSVDATGCKAEQYSEKEGCSICSFEYIYLARPDSNIHRRNLHLCRIKMGRNLFQEYPLDADMVIGVPYSGIPAAIGFSKESGIPYDDVLIKNRYIGRTFIQPEQSLRELGVKVKLNPIRSAIHNKRIVLVDDSIVRGTTSRKIVQLLRDAGAKEVHMRISSPPVKFPCFYGIDTPESKELIASSLNTSEIKQHLNVDSLGYLSIEGLVNAIHLPVDYLCLACFNKKYPVHKKT
ncbi:MAG: Amidophosphoribosyltransferase [Candidatus Magnetoglobus multicellularis str. Araruama]|uniref:Amidophosphoribosyltransferase n=1 Tax=Candidatus Magnetoglobus multicellularis str. Araruama TaxID=890399 RepID=A0A1V1P0W6_9BACT|nr:MAG: Amidophosphoribosyltransferase [Candidatus Magnetoglobus multicellularis str. Araruama]